MRNDLKLILLAAITFILCVLLLLAMSACLDSVSFPDEWPDEIEIEGDINVTDITSAVLLIINRSKTVDVTEVAITQGGKQIVSFTGKPKALEKKAQYLTPSDISYDIHIKYFDYKAPGEGFQKVTIPLPLPRQEYELFIYRTKDGVIVIDREVNDPDPNDTGDPADDPLKGEGSVPAVIPPASRDRISPVIIINRTNDRVVDTVSFKMDDRSYTITGGIPKNDRGSIALGHGRWEAKATYTLNSILKTTTAKHVIVGASSDPLSAKEHYLNFYKNTGGDYCLSTEWPASDVDEDSLGDDDRLPPLGNPPFGRGTLIIVNETNYLVESIELTNKVSGNAAIFDYESFLPPMPIANKKSGQLRITGTKDFPIENGAKGFFDVAIYLIGNNSDAMFKSTVYLYENVATLYIRHKSDEGSEIVTIDPPQPPVTVSKATVIIKNDGKSSDVNIEQITITNKNKPSEQRTFGMATWQPIGAIKNNNWAEFLLLDSDIMPIGGGRTFKITLGVRYNGKLYPVEKSRFAEGDDIPVNGTRTVILTEDEVKQIINNTPTPIDPPQFWYTEEAVIRFYGVSSIDPIRAIILVEDYHSEAQTGSSEALIKNYGTDPANTANGMQTGRTKIKVSSNYNDFNGTSITGIGMNTDKFARTVLASHLNNNTHRDAKVWIIPIEGNVGRVISYDRNKTLVEQTPNSGRLGNGPNQVHYVDVSMPALSGNNNGWYVYFWTGFYNWMISYTAPSFNAPPVDNHFRFFIGAELMNPNGKYKSILRVQDGIAYDTITEGNRPTAEDPGSYPYKHISGTKVVLPVGHSPNVDTTSIMRYLNGRLRHTATHW